MTDPVYLAIDMGAESGRVIAAVLSGGAFRLEEMNRFPNQPRELDGHLRWDLEALWAGIRSGLGVAAQRYGDAVRSIAVDTWGVDYGLLDAQGQLLADPIHYRDPRTGGWPERARGLVSDRDWWQRTGVRSMVFNTAYQVLAEDRALLERAERLLTMPDLVAWKLSGVAANEWTNASTSQLCTAGTGAWDRDLLRLLDLPQQLFKPTSPSGTVLGPLLPGLAAEAGWGDHRPQVVLTAGHDTGSAVAAMPTASGAYISCGTWSLMGVVSPDPVVSEVARERQLSNELAWDGRTRLLKNIMGLWVVQNCKRAFAAEGRAYDYATLTSMAAGASDPALPLEVDDQRFFAPGSAADPYLDRLRAWYAEQGAPAPADDGATVRAVLLGLAQAYRSCMDDLAAATGQAPERIVMIGGGGRNTLLQQFTVEACGVEVVVGSTEATALGNALIQAVACGDLDAADLPKVSAASSDEPVSILD